MGVRVEHGDQHIRLVSLRSDIPSLRPQDALPANSTKTEPEVIQNALLGKQQSILGECNDDFR